jgi:hypothetical protein
MDKGLVLGLASADDQIDRATYAIPRSRSRLTPLPYCPKSCKLDKPSDLTPFLPVSSILSTR